MSIVQFFQKNGFFRKHISRVADARAEDMVKRILPYLHRGDRVLDIGPGTCNITKSLRNRDFDVTPLDTKDLSFVDSVKPLIYDGEKMPFDDNTFDVSILLTMLHHTPSPDAILLEAKRVSKRIIIIEDIYRNAFEKYETYFFDSLLNLEFSGHPHTNRSDEGWRTVFQEMGLRIMDAKYQRSFAFFYHATYCLEK